MRHVMPAVAAATMLGLGAAQAAQPAMAGHQPGAEAHHQPTAHHLVAEADGAGADVASNRHLA